ncbi:hypothetical protein FKP32DRAFT_434111 [Trametes sanguinea]|nr:hypothetical protein FKP32DRAFT_434111 [Trametes sanguinea]
MRCGRPAFGLLLDVSRDCTGRMEVVTRCYQLPTLQIPGISWRMVAVEARGKQSVIINEQFSWTLRAPKGQHACCVHKISQSEHHLHPALARASISDGGRYGIGCSCHVRSKTRSSATAFRQNVQAQLQALRMASKTSKLAAASSASLRLLVIYNTLVFVIWHCGAVATRSCVAG